MMRIKDNTKDILISMVVIMIIFWLWFIYGKWRENIFGTEKEYNFISPLLDCKEASVLQNSKNIDIEPSLNKLIENKLRNSGVNHVSIYFRDLNNGYRFGINEKESFTPASLTKVPTMIAVLKRSESENGFLEQSVKFSLPKFDYNVHYKPKLEIESNKVYTIRQLLDYMIKYSDNNSTQILRNILWKDRFSNTYWDLWVISNQSSEIQVLDYASFFRILFNASYLNKENSEYALNLLTQVDFRNWLVSGLPPSIKISHKFWEYSLNGNEKQIHDCWIVYYPDHPYLICVMTRGNNYDNLEKILSEVSRLVFENINEEYGIYKK